MKVMVALLFGLMLVGCQSMLTHELQKSTLAVEDKIKVLSAKVENPYPKCKPDGKLTRVADLSVERSQRVYLQGGRLCQRIR